VAAKERRTGKPGGSSKQIDAIVREQRGWKGATLARLRALILQADPAIAEEVKWRKPSNPAGVPVWSHDGIVCTGNVLKSTVRITFMKGAALDGKTRLYNASLEGNRMRAVDFFEGDPVDEEAFKDLVRAAVRLNQSKK
jgi:hypothetical protein